MTQRERAAMAVVLAVTREKLANPSKRDTMLLAPPTTELHTV